MRRIAVTLVVAALALLTSPGAIWRSGEAHAASATANLAGPFIYFNDASGGWLDQSWSGGVEHPEIIAYPDGISTNQEWYREDQDDGTAVFRNFRSGKCLDQDYSGGVPHTDVIAYTCTYNDNQKWILYRQADGTYLIRNNASLNYLDQDYSGGVAHPDVIVWPFNGGRNQHWCCVTST